MVVTAGEEPERRVAAALRAQATGVGHPLASRPAAPAAPSSGVPSPGAPPPAGAAATDRADRTAAAAGRATTGLRSALAGSRVTLALVLLGGLVLGTALALLSLVAPGVLPPLG